MDHYEWHYEGDVGIRHGGHFWRETGDDDSVMMVKVVPCSDAGGPDNLFRLSVGTLHIPDDEAARRSALAVVGVDAVDPTRQDLVRAFDAYGTMDTDEDYVIRIGKQDRLWSGRGDNPEPDLVLREGTSLRKWIMREYLHREPVREPDGPRS